jgi:hypothetical protein
VPPHFAAEAASLRPGHEDQPDGSAGVTPRHRRHAEDTSPASIRPALNWTPETVITLLDRRHFHLRDLAPACQSRQGGSAAA